MKPRFTERCVKTVMEKIIGTVRTPIMLKLEEMVRSTQTADDFDHSLDFTMTYPSLYDAEKTSRVKIVDVVTLPCKEPVGREYLTSIYELLNDHIKVEKNYDLSITDEHTNEQRYAGSIKITRK